MADPMGAGFTVDVREVRAHATSVSTVAVEVRAAASGAQDSVGGGAFGQLGQFFAAAITQACARLRESMEHVGATVDQMESGLSQTADAYETIDQAHGSLFDRSVPAPQVRA